MAATHGWRRWRLFVLLGLVLMIFVRLVWMQLRHYPVSMDVRIKAALEIGPLRFHEECRRGKAVWYAPTESRDLTSGKDPLDEGAVRSWMASPGGVLLGMLGCQADMGLDVFFVRANQWLLMGTVLCAVLLVRFTTSSWTAVAIVATMLLSRGRFLTELGNISVNGVLQCAFTLWVAAWAHFFRSGSKMTGAVGSLVAILAGLLDGAALVLALAIPGFLLLSFSLRKSLARPMIRRYRGQPGDLVEVQRSGGTVGEKEAPLRRMAEALRWLIGIEVPALVRKPSQHPDYRSGSLFVTLKVPFLLWAFYGQRWRKVLAAGCFSFGFGMVILIGAKMGLSGSEWFGLRSLDLSLVKSAAKELLSLGWLQSWFWSFARVFDAHYAWSFVVLGLCAAVSPSRGLPAYWETVWLTLTAMVFLLCSSLFLDSLDTILLTLVQTKYDELTFVKGLAQMKHRDFLLWTEPVVLSLAVAGIYNLMEVLYTRGSERSSGLPKVRGKS